jgi:hypothetical protein
VATGKNDDRKAECNWKLLQFKVVHGESPFLVMER